jgi:hypothetical protein
MQVMLMMMLGRKKTDGWQMFFEKSPLQEHLGMNKINE